MASLDDIYDRATDYEAQLNIVPTNRRGKIINKLRGTKLAHPCRCGRHYGDARMTPQAARMCLGCEGVIVLPSNKGLVIRRSERIRKRTVAEEDAKRRVRQRVG